MAYLFKRESYGWKGGGFPYIFVAFTIPKHSALVSPVTDGFLLKWLLCVSFCFYETDQPQEGFSHQLSLLLLHFGVPLANRKNNAVSIFWNLLPLGHYTLFLLSYWFFSTCIASAWSVPCPFFRSLRFCWTGNADLSLQEESFTYQKHNFWFFFYWPIWTLYFHLGGLWNIVQS